MGRRSTMRSYGEVLAELGVFMEDGTIPNTDKRLLWDVLTALRGPDDTGSPKSEDCKLLTTAVIRHEIFGEGLRDEIGALTLAEDPSFGAKREDLYCGWAAGAHFQDHARMAFDALWLKFF